MKRYDLPALLLIVTFCPAALFGCHADLPEDSFRLINRQDLCTGVRVYAKRDQRYHVGELITGGVIGDGDAKVAAINLSVIVDGETRSVYRREEEVMRWYVRADLPTRSTPELCFGDTPSRHLAPSNLEYSLDHGLWLRRFGRGWSTSPGWRTTGFKV